MWAVSRVLDRIYDELERAPFILCFRGSLCTRSFMFEEWLEDLYHEAVEQTVRALSEASYDADLGFCPGKVTMRYLVSRPTFLSPLTL